MRNANLAGGTTPHGQLEMEVVIRHALGETDVDVKGINAQVAFEVQGEVTAVIAWKSKFTERQVDEQIIEAEQLARARGWNPPLVLLVAMLDDQGETVVGKCDGASACSRFDVGPVRRLRADPRQNPIVHDHGLLDVQEVASVLNNLHPRPGREVALGILDESEINASVAVPVQIQGWLRTSGGQRRLFGRIRAIRAEVP